MNPDKKKNTARSLSLGTRILLVVALITNACIALLIYVNQRSSQMVEETAEELLVIHRMLSDNLRHTVVGLQEDYLSLPGFFSPNPHGKVVRYLQQEFPNATRQVYPEQGAYRDYYNRAERRDLAQGKYIVSADTGELNISYGEVDEAAAFTGKVVRFTISSDQATEQAEQVIKALDTIVQQESGADFLKSRIQALSERVADAGLQAERGRTEVLGYLDTIAAKENRLQEVREQQRRFTTTMGVVVGGANLIVLFLLIRHLVEKPLSGLTRAIDEIRRGTLQEVPYRKRQDQIGQLSGALERFRLASIELSREHQRKKEEKEIIEQVFQTVAATVAKLNAHAGQLLRTSAEMEQNAEISGSQTAEVSLSARQTAQHTERVAASAGQLHHEVREVAGQVADQSQLISHLVEMNETSRDHMSDLEAAVKAIDSIIAMVQEITDQTHLLALNATIEAARAGTAGKGFAVVAGEMKSLSSRTGEAATEVLEKVEAISRASSTIWHNFSTMEANFYKLEATASQISQLVERQRQAVATISGMAEKTAVNTQHVSTTIVEVNVATDKTRQMAGTVKRYAEEMAEQLTLLLTQTSTRLRLIHKKPTGDPPQHDSATFPVAAPPPLLENAA